MFDQLEGYGLIVRSTKKKQGMTVNMVALTGMVENE
jgi:hypothetical protein